MRWLHLLLVLLAASGSLQAQTNDSGSAAPALRPTDFDATPLILTIDGLAPLPAPRPRIGGAAAPLIVLPPARPVTDQKALEIVAKPAPRPSQIPTRLPLDGAQDDEQQPELAALPELPRACLDQLRTLRVTYTPLPNRQFGGGCNLTQAVEVTDFDGIVLSPAGQMTCTTAVATAQWLQTAVVPESRLRLGKTLSGIDHYSTYSCRRRPSGGLSEHASGNAIDVARFHFTDGNMVSLNPDWRQGSAATRHFLKAIAKASCAFFSVVLTPESDKAHFNHFHFDNGRWHSCDG